jgi:two-component sensor histidine kinase/Flp pilus assembly protein TadD
MKKKLLTLILCVAQISFAQTSPPDSLEIKYAAAKNDESRLAILADMVNASFGKDIGKALDYAMQGVQLAEKTNNKKAQPEFYEMAGRMHANLLHLDTAVIFFDKAMAGYKAINNKKGQATTWFKVAWVHKKQQQIDKAMDADMNGLKLMEEINDQGGIANALSRVSDDLSRQGRLKEALDYAKKAINICETNGMKTEAMFAYFNAGNVSIAMNQNTESLAYYDKAIESCQLLNAGDIALSDFTNARGNALKRLGRLPEALSEYKKAQALAQKSNYTNAINTVIANLGEVNLMMGNYAEALKYQLKTVELQELAGDNSNLVENYLHTSTIYEKLGNYPSALAYQKKALLLRDSTATKESDEAMSELLTKYETEKKQATIASQQQQLTQQRRVQWLSVGAVALLAILLIVGYRSYRARTKTNKLLAAKNAENELLLKEIHHRVKNNLEVVSSLLALQSAQIDDPNTKEAMLEGQNRVQSIGIVHQKLYQGEQLGAIEMKDYFINLSESILDSFGADKRVQVECMMEKINVDIDTAVPLGLIVNELLTNTLKYAFPNKQDGKVQIKLEQRKNGILHLEVSDNGIGKTGITHGTGFGGQLVSLLTRQLGGSMREEMINGTSVIFEFRPEKAA